MQQELTDLQPELIKTSQETEVLMEKIAQDTVEVEAQKEVSILQKFRCFSLCGVDKISSYMYIKLTSLSN